MSAQPEASQFDRFWDAWPNNGSKGFEAYTRKKDKKKCEETWRKRHFDREAAAILNDVEARRKYDKGWRDNKGGFLSAPLVYLNNERWNDGAFADVRDQLKTQQRDAPKAKKDEGPEMSRWARGANKILMSLAYMDVRRGFVPLGKEKLRELLAAKSEYIRIAEEADRIGERWPDEDFIDMCREGFEKVLGS